MEQEKINLKTLTEPISPWVMSYVITVISDYFVSNLKNVQIKLLSGGYSAAANVLLEIVGKSYVLRVINEIESPLNRNKEFYAMQEAAAAGIAPPIHWISHNNYGILMDYIPSGTLTIKQGKNPQILSNIAASMRKVHALHINPFGAPSFEAQMEEFYHQYAEKNTHQATWDDAIDIIKDGSLQLQSLNAPKVNTHGDLNPRNILLSHQDVFFIDWGDGMDTDPFQDLAFFSIMMDYDPKEEVYFMQNYLGHAPTFNERKRFKIAKKMNFGRLTLSGQGIGNQLSMNHKNEGQPLDYPKEWSYYAQTFANGNTHLSSQFFWGQAQTALKCAKALDINDVEI